MIIDLGYSRPDGDIGEDHYNGRRPHASLDGNTPVQAYFNSPPSRMAA
jgi:transposase InsO family protein